MIQADEGDIGVYLSNEILKDHHTNAMDAALKEEIFQAIISKSQGMYALSSRLK